MDIMYERSDGTIVKMLVTAAYFKDGDTRTYIVTRLVCVN